MIKFRHDGPQMSHRKTCYKGYDGEDTPRWNLEVEPFFVQWIVQMEEDTHKLRMVKDHMLPSSVVGKEMCYCRLMLKLQKGKDIDQP